jgi:hypothetical protein
MDDIGGAVYDIPIEVKIIRDDGSAASITKDDGTINQKTSRILAQQVLDDLTKNHSYDQLHDGEIRALKNLAQSVAKDSGTKYETDAAFDKMKHKLAGFLHTKKLRRDLAGGGEKAKQAKMFMAIKMFHAGGSDDDNLVCDYRALLSGENYVFKQNDPLRDAWSSIRNDEDSTWDIEITDAGTIELTSGGMKISTTNDIVNNKNSAGKTSSSNVNIATTVNKAVMRNYDSSGGTLNNSTELGNLLSRIEELFEKARVLTLK